MYVTNPEHISYCKAKAKVVADKEVIYLLPEYLRPNKGTVLRSLNPVIQSFPTTTRIFHTSTGCSAVNATQKKAKFSL